MSTVFYTMNLLTLLTKEKHVAGIEINDSTLRVAFFRQDKTARDSYFSKFNILNYKLRPYSTPVDSTLVLIEELLPPNIVVEGKVIDSLALGKIIKGVWLQSKIETNYAIVAIPDDEIYSQIFSFPKTVSGERLNDAMRLVANFQLPTKIEGVYLDWKQVNTSSNMNEMLISSIPRAVAQGFIDALNIAWIKPLALESHLASIARAIKIEDDQAIIFTKKTSDDATVFILKNKIVNFSRAIPTRFVPKNKFDTEVERIKKSFESEMKSGDKPVIVMDILKASILDEYASHPELTEPKSNWLATLGAVIRGALPEGEDHLISLLPVKPDQAYTYHKATIFVGLVRNMIIGVSVFFTIAFLAVYFFMLSISKTTEHSTMNLSTSDASTESLNKEKLIQNINGLTSTAKSILSETPVWGNLLNEIKLRTINGVVISNISVPSVTDRISLSGSAKDRVTLNQFKKSLQDSPMFTEIEIPITNISQKESIPFSASFRIKDVSTIYYGQSESYKVKSP